MSAAAVTGTLNLSSAASLSGAAAAAGGPATAGGATATGRVAGARFALDPASLNELKRKTREGGADAQGKALRQAAGQFEAVFMNMLLKSMRETLPKDGALDSDTTRTFTGMYDAQIAQKLADKGVGLADMIVRQVEARSGPQPGGTQPGGTQPGAVRPAGAAAGSGATPDAVAPLRRVGAMSTIDKLRTLTAEAQGAERTPAMALRAAPGAGLGGAVPGSAPGATPGAAPREFVQRMWESAKSAEQATGMPAQFILGQAALESGWGRREIRHGDGSSSHNLFGIKAGAGWSGPVVKATTTEFVNGVARKSVETFRAYASYAESFADYARLINNNPRYAATRSAGTDAAVFAQSLQSAGYATDPLYAAKLTRVIAQTVRVTA